MFKTGFGKTGFGKKPVCGALEDDLPTSWRRPNKTDLTQDTKIHELCRVTSRK